MSDRKYKLYSDSTCDLSEDILKNMNVTLLELSFEVNGVVKSKNDMTLPEFYSQMRNGAVTKTSQIGISDYEQAFEFCRKRSVSIRAVTGLWYSLPQFWTAGGY